MTPSYPPSARPVVIVSTDDNTSLLPGANQLVIEADTGKQKLGDAVTHYHDLPYRLTPQTLVRRDIPIAFDTPGLHAGHDLFTPQAGELFLLSWVTIETPWDGPVDNTTYVQLFLGLAGFTLAQIATIDAANGAVASAVDASGLQGKIGGLSAGIIAGEAVAFQARIALFDGNSGDDIGSPTSTQGALTVHVISVPPS